jgi:hypothetical protein
MPYNKIKDWYHYDSVTKEIQPLIECPGVRTFRLCSPWDLSSNDVPDWDRLRASAISVIERRIQKEKGDEGTRQQDKQHMATLQLTTSEGCVARCALACEILSDTIEVYDRPQRHFYYYSFEVTRKKELAWIVVNDGGREPTSKTDPDDLFYQSLFDADLTQFRQSLFLYTGPPTQVEATYRLMTGYVARVAALKL